MEARRTEFCRSSRLAVSDCNALSKIRVARFPFDQKRKWSARGHVRAYVPMGYDNTEKRLRLLSKPLDRSMAMNR